uniref:Uncharacterized protein n=1 Tax=Haptolina brevifila TaxID=156173 RepID=A0A7S2GCE0_9EUKA
MITAIARTAPNGVIGFTLHPDFVTASARPLATAVIKVTLFDVLAGTVRLTQAHLTDEGLAQLTEPMATTGDGVLKTFTFVVDSTLRVRSADSTYLYDFEVTAEAVSGAAQALVLSMVRVVKTGNHAPSSSVGPQAVVRVPKTVVKMSATGDVTDYDDSAKADLADKFAALAGVDSSAVEVEVSAASVLITVKITVADVAAASALTTSISSQLADPSAASAFTGLTITSAPTIAVAMEAGPAISNGWEPPTPPPMLPGAPPSPTEQGFWQWWVIFVVAVGSTCGCVCCILACLFMVMKRGGSKGKIKSDQGVASAISSASSTQPPIVV